MMRALTRTSPSRIGERRSGQEHDATSQLYFPEATTDEVFRRAPYCDRPNRDTTNASDEIFPTGGDPAVLEVRPHGGGNLAVARLHLPPN